MPIGANKSIIVVKLENSRIETQDYVYMKCCDVAAGMLSIGSLVGCLLAGVCMERLGRRVTLLVVTSAAYTAGFLAILLAPSAAVIYLGRFLSGLGLGLVLSTATIYIVEIASTDMRGVLGCCIQFMGGG